VTGPYGAPPPQMPAAPARKDRSTLFGVLGVVIGFICCPLAGVILGILAIRDAKAAGKSSALGIAAVIVSVIAAVGGGVYYASRR
jgi:hypothetical protein